MKRPKLQSLVLLAALGSCSIESEAPTEDLAAELVTLRMLDARKQSEAQLEHAEALLARPLGVSRERAEIEVQAGRAAYQLHYYADALRHRSAAATTYLALKQIVLACDEFWVSLRLAIAALRDGGAAAELLARAGRHCADERFAGAASYHHWRAVFALDLHFDPQAALDALDEALRIARQQGDLEAEMGAFSLRARILARLGRAPDMSSALQQFERRLADVAPASVLVDSGRAADRNEAEVMLGRALAAVLTDAAWIELSRVESGEAPSGDPSSSLRKALAIYSAPTTMDSGQVANVTINLALAHLQHGDLVAARNTMTALVPDSLSPEERLWYHGLYLRLAATREEVTGPLTALAAVSDADDDPQFRWHAAYWRGLALERIGDVDGANGAYREAEEVLDWTIPPLSLGAWRERWITSWQMSSRRLVQVLLRQGQPDEALCAARLARRRGLRVVEHLGRAQASGELRIEQQRLYDEQLALEIDAQQDATLGDDKRHAARLARATRRREQARRHDLLFAGFVDEGDITCANLREPRDGELLLFYVETDDGWTVLAQEGTPLGAARTTATALGVLRPGARAELLAPIAPQLARVRGPIRVMATGELHAVDFAGLPWQGGRLEAHAPVVYPLDVPSSDYLATPEEGAALLVVDPTEDTRPGPIASDATRALGYGGYDVAVLNGASATRSEVIAGLDVTLMLYFGHGERSDEAALDSVAAERSFLRLAAATELRVEDVLLAPAVPDAVVLSGCVTGMVDPHSTGPVLGLGQAFLIRGARIVVASTENVGQCVSIPLFAALVEVIGRDGPSTSTLAKARAAVLAEPPKCGVDVERALAGWRLWVGG
jgi:tetratricopeptide (TPR) repeat protein